MPELAYRNGQFIPRSEAHLPLHDAGFVFGATVTDLCRTFRQRLFRLPDHLARFRRGCSAIGIPLAPADPELTRIAEQLISHNAAELGPAEELGLVMCATPGPLAYYAGQEQEPSESDSTLVLHTFTLRFGRFRRFIQEGAHLVVPNVRHVPAESIDPRIKHRSRLHWWLAEQEARRLQPGSVALLVDTDGHVTETAGANFLIVSQGTVLSPPEGSILSGISLQVVRELCRELGIGFAERPLSLPECLAAEEAMLSSTPYCLAGVSQINGAAVPWPGPIFQRLLAAWSAQVGVDIARQILPNP